MQLCSLYGDFPTQSPQGKPSAATKEGAGTYVNIYFALSRGQGLLNRFKFCPQPITPARCNTKVFRMRQFFLYLDILVPENRPYSVRLSRSISIHNSPKPNGARVIKANASRLIHCQAVTAC